MLMQKDIFAYSTILCQKTTEKHICRSTQLRLAVLSKLRLCRIINFEVERLSDSKFSISYDYLSWTSLYVYLTTRAPWPYNKCVLPFLHYIDQRVWKLLSFPLFFCKKVTNAKIQSQNTSKVYNKLCKNVESRFQVFNRAISRQHHVEWVLLSFPASDQHLIKLDDESIFPRL